MFGMVAVQGIRMLLEVDFSNDKNLLIVAVSVDLGWVSMLRRHYSVKCRKHCKCSLEMAS